MAADGDEPISDQEKVSELFYDYINLYRVLAEKKLNFITVLWNWCYNRFKLVCC